jgi:hypothetical protein
MKGDLLMLFLSGRAVSGALSVLRAAFVGAAAIVALSSCGNNNFTYGTPLITFSVTPGPFTSYLVEIDQILLTRNDNTPVYPLLQPQVVDFVKLSQLPEVFGAPAILEGTYTSASITVNYGATVYQPAGALIYMNVNGHSTVVSPVDTTGTGTASTSVTYTVKFDPNHPLVIKHGISTPLDFNFDLSAASVINTSTAPIQVTTRPFISASTVPNYTQPLRARGVYVTTDTQNNNNFTMNSRSFFDTQGSPTGAIEIQTSDSTVYNINGTLYQGAAGLAQINKLQINTIVEAYGTFGDLNNIKPNFVATQVFAGVSVENVLTDRITGTVSSVNGTTVHIAGAEVEARNFNVATGVTLSFQDDLTLTTGPSTLINVDGHPELTNVTTDYISVGQQVDMEALAVTDSSGNVVLDANGLPTWSVASGLVRLIPTTGWGLQSSSGSGDLTAGLISLGGSDIIPLQFAGTNSNWQAYTVSTSGLDTSALAANTLVRFDGLVSPFGTAPPDFVADSVTPGSATDQVMTVEWTSAGTGSPFVSKDANGLVVNVSGGNLASSPRVQTGPLYIQSSLTNLNSIDLGQAPTNPTIVVGTTLQPQLTIGNPTSTTGLAEFHDYSSFLTNLNTVLNGTNTILKLVAVGKYDSTSNTFTAYRLDLVQLP